MKVRSALLALAGALIWTAECRAASPRNVIIIAPARQTCISAQELAMGIANAGAFSATVAADADALPESAGEAAVFQIEGQPGRLRIRGWGVRSPAVSGGLWPWPGAWSERPPDLERELPAHACETATEAAIGFVASVLTPAPQPSAAPVEEGGALAAVLERAQRDLDSGLTAGVLRTELGLSLIVEDLHSSCRRGSWLEVREGTPRLGHSVAALQREVLACLEEERAKSQRAPRLERAPASHAAVRGFELPGATGVLIAALGTTAAYVGAARSLAAPATVLYTVAPAVAGGLGGYFFAEPAREALWLAGYWSGVAGSSLVLAARSGAAKPVLIGGFLAAGSAGSAALSLAGALAEEPRMPAWGIALPAAAGAGLAGLGLLVNGRTENSVQLAGLGGLAALAPALWLGLSSGTDEVPRRSPGLDLSFNSTGALIRVAGEL